MLHFFALSYLNDASTQFRYFYALSHRTGTAVLAQATTAMKLHSAIPITALVLAACTAPAEPPMAQDPAPTAVEHPEPEWFNLRPEVERMYGYTHGVRIGDRITISGAVSMDDQGNPTAVGDMTQQMKNCYADLDKVLRHFGCTFDDVVAENVFTTDMARFIEVSGAYRSTIYPKQFPAGSWLEVKGLALPGFMIEIELEVHKSK